MQGKCQISAVLDPVIEPVPPFQSRRQRLLAVPKLERRFAQVAHAAGRLSWNEGHRSAAV